MHTTASINFFDRVNNDHAWAGTRVGDDTIALALSLRSDGDLELFFGPQEARVLAAGLLEAAAQAEASGEQ